MKRTVIALATLAALALTVFAQKTATLEAQLGAIINQAEGKGDFEGAIPEYKKFVAENGKNKSLAANALFHLAVAYEKLSDPEAQKVYERLIRDYPSEPISSSAKGKLAALSTARFSAELSDRRICTDCGGDRDPASISADGRFVVFNSKTGLSTLDPVSRQVRVVMPRRVLSPILSPDLKRIVYLGSTKDETFAPSGDPDKYQLQVVDNEVGAKPKTLNSNTEYMALIPAAWKSDGSAVLVAAHKRVDQTWALAWVSTSDGSVTHIKSLGWRFGCCGPLGLPSLSPDGRYVAYAASVRNDVPGTRFDTRAADFNDTHIYILPLDGSAAEIELVKGASINEGAVWMPDGKGLLFVSNRAGNFGLWSVAFPSGTLEPLRANTGEIHTLGMTRSGSYVYSRRPQPATFELQIAELNTSTDQRGDDALDTINGLLPAWSPDGKRIAFMRRPTPDSIARELLVYTLETRDEKRYVPSSNIGDPVDTPVWLHNGQSILQFVLDPKGERTLYRVDLKSGEFKQIRPAVSTSNFVVSLDDRIYVAAPGAAAPGACRMDTILEIDLRSGQQRQLASLPAPDSSSLPTSDSLVLSPDGKTLYTAACEKGEGTRQAHLVAVDINTGAQRYVLSLKDPDRIHTPFVLSPDGMTFVVQIGNADRASITGKFQLSRVGIAGEGYRKIVDLESFARNISWSADGSTVNVLPVRPASITVPARDGHPAVRSISQSEAIRRISPDRSRAIYFVSDTRQELWALDNVKLFSKTPQ
jgi:Tol biopolymer transport system component